MTDLNPYITRLLSKLGLTTIKEADKRSDKVVFYVPISQETWDRIKDKQTIGTKYALHDGRVGWVERKEFADYAQYVRFLDDNAEYQQYITLKAKK